MILDKNLDMRVKKNVEELLQRNINEIDILLNNIGSSGNIEKEARGVFYLLDTFCYSNTKLLKKEKEIMETCRKYFYVKFPRYEDYYRIVRCFSKNLLQPIFNTCLVDFTIEDMDALMIKAAEYVFCDSSNFGKNLTLTQVIQIIKNRLTAERRNKYIDEILS